MRALKAIVIGMGGLILLAVVLIGFGLYKKSVEPGWKLFGSQIEVRQTSTEAPVPGVFDNIRLGLPNGCFIVEARPDGRRVYLQTGPEPECEGIIVIDVDDGRILGRITAR